MNYIYKKRPGSSGILQSITPPDRSNPNEQFEELPGPSGKTPYHLNLTQIWSIEEVNRIEEIGSISFHIVGDTGGTKKPENQKIVEIAMEKDFKHKDKTKVPIFLYHLGDVVYKFGEASEYNPQFYEPYEFYPGPIFAIPGNKDGSIRKAGVSINKDKNTELKNESKKTTIVAEKEPNKKVQSLKAFVDNFCAKTQHVTPDAEEANRPAMIQPNVYWTLEAPFINIIGLYSNVPDGGEIREPQFNWFVDELKNAHTNKALAVCVHHSPFSVDNKRSGSEYILNRLDSAFELSGRIPDIVFSGHVHNYQRFTRQFKEREIPYIVAGTGGHWDLNHIQTFEGNLPKVPFNLPDRDDVVLENYCDNRHGFLKVQVSSNKLIGKYFGVSRPHESWRKPAKRIDEFVLDLKKHKIN
ncbi:MAG TPA: metallophosphoesterase [Verrucomicrobiae bacterium]|nr:metallophosphoesterase [Verrucomicrobiae bacterium]